MTPKELVGKLVVLNDGSVFKVEEVYVLNDYEFQVKFDSPLRFKRGGSRIWRWVNQDFTFQFDRNFKIVKVLHGDSEQG